MKTALLLLALVLGMVFPQGYTYSFMIRYLIMSMLFMSFLGVKIDKNFLNKNVFLVLLANIGIAFTSYYLLLSVNKILALAAFITAITPTATAAPVITKLLKGKVEYVTASVILTNCGVALLIPFVLPGMIGLESNISVQKVLSSVLFTVFVPLLTAQSIKTFLPKLRDQLAKYQKVSFYIWLSVLYLAIAKATNFITNDLTAPISTVLMIGASSFLICVVNFSLGKFIGGKEYSREASQSLGQKNTMFTIWVALTFINPLIALGPVFYVICHNSYNSYQLYRTK